MCLPSLILPIFESQRIFVFRLQSQLRTRCFAINEMWTHLYLQKSTPISCECKKHNWSVKAASFNCFISWFCSLILGLPQWWTVMRILQRKRSPLAVCSGTYRSHLQPSKPIFRKVLLPQIEGWKSGSAAVLCLFLTATPLNLGLLGTEYSEGLRGCK